MDLSAALPTFVITLREGVEAALVVGIVLACLNKAKQTQLNQWVYRGIGAGLAASLAIGLLLGWGFQQIHRLGSRWEALLEPGLKAVLCGVAIAMLSWMLIWMTRQARSLKGEIQGSVDQMLARSSSEEGGLQGDSEIGHSKAEQAAGWGIFSLIFIAVLREGCETAIFILANLQQGAAATVGAIAGLVGATAIGLALFKFGLRINLKRFFQVMGLLLLLIVAGLVTSLIKNLDGVAIALQQQNLANLCWSQASCAMGPLLWDTSAVLPDKQFPGLIFKTLLGYRDHLYGLQAAGYLAFIAAVGSLYFRSLGLGIQTKPSARSQADAKA